MKYLTLFIIVFYPLCAVAETQLERDVYSNILSIGKGSNSGYGSYYGQQQAYNPYNGQSYNYGSNYYSGSSDSPFMHSEYNDLENFVNPVHSEPVKHVESPAQNNTQISSSSGGNDWLMMGGIFFATIVGIIIIILGILANPLTWLIIIALLIAKK